MRIIPPYWWVIALPILFVALGALSNQVVLIANHDKFPVMVNNRKLQGFLRPADEEEVIKSVTIDGLIQIPLSTLPVGKVRPYDPDGMIDNVHCIMSPSSRFKALADIWDLRAIYSVGDGLILLGTWFLSFAQTAWIVLVLRKLIPSME